LQRQIRLAEDIITFAIERNNANPVKFVKATFKPSFNISELEKIQSEKAASRSKLNKDFFFQFDDYIKSKEKSVAPSTLDVFKNLKVILESFQAFRKTPITFETIDYNFYEEFVHYLTYEHIHRNKKEIIKGFKSNTIGKNVKQLIIFLKNRKKKKLITEADTTGFKILEEEADAIYLSPEEISQIYSLDLFYTKHLITSENHNLITVTPNLAILKPTIS